MNKTKIKKYSKKVLNFTKDNIWYLVGAGLGSSICYVGYHVGFIKGVKAGYDVIMDVYDKNQDIYSK